MERMKKEEESFIFLHLQISLSSINTYTMSTPPPLSTPTLDLIATQLLHSHS